MTRQRTASKCSKCSRPPTPGFTKCLYCREAERQACKRYRARTASGVCKRCKQPSLVSYCDTCKTKYREYARAKRAKRKVIGICIWCPTPIWREGSALCDKHRKQVANQVWRRNGVFGTRHSEFRKYKDNAIWTELKSQLNGHFAEVKPWIEEHFDLFKDNADHILYAALPIESWLAKEDADDNDEQMFSY